MAIISNLKSKSNSGHDGVSSKLVKDLKYALSLPLSIIINNSLSEGLVPDMAKLAKIIPIYKAKDKNNISNYRPISLLPVISKILEKVIHTNFSAAGRLIFVIAINRENPTINRRLIDD